MQRLELDEKVINGKLVIDMPAEFDNEVVHITVVKKVFKVDADARKWPDIPREEKNELLKKYFGSAKYPDFPMDKYDVYDQ